MHSKMFWWLTNRMIDQLSIEVKHACCGLTSFPTFAYDCFGRMRTRTD